jgi:hypothetical protein
MNILFRIYNLAIFELTLLCRNQEDNFELNIFKLTIFPLHLFINKYGGEINIGFLIYDFNEETVRYWGRAWGEI